jgi:predicted HNH restriction endonuclease
MGGYYKIRMRVIAKLGSKCQYCGFDTDVRALAIDHVHNDGYKHRKVHRGGTAQYIRDIERSVDAKDGRFQLLCCNCDRIKEQNHREQQNIIAEEIALLSLVDFTCEINRVIGEGKEQ